MFTVDSQIHIWAEDTPERPWPEFGIGHAHTDEPLTADSLLPQMDAAGVDRAVLVPPSWEGDRNDLAIAAARAHPDRFAVMARIDLEDPDSPARLPDLISEPGVLGLRLTFHRPHMKRWLPDGVADWVWVAAEKMGFPIMVLPREQIGLIGDVADRHPDLRLVIDHMGLDSGAPKETVFDALEGLYPLAARPNIAVKLSSLPSYAHEPYPYPRVHEHAKRIIETFGPARSFWGTDLSRLPCSYEQAISLFTEEFTFLSDTDKELIMGMAVCDWLGWDR